MRDLMIVNPARAGMILRRRRSRNYGARKPRASGDDPGEVQVSYSDKIVNPALAGMIPLARAASACRSCKPRASGDDPLCDVGHKQAGG